MTISNTVKAFLIVTSFLFLVPAPLKADANKTGGDLIKQKLEYVTKADQTLESVKKDTADLLARVRFAPHKNHRKIEYLVEKLQKEHKEAEGVMGNLRIATESEWSSFKPKLDTLFSDMRKDLKEGKDLQK